MTVVSLKERGNDNIINGLMKMSVSDYSINNDIVPVMMDCERPICMFINHSSMISWTAAPLALIDWSSKTGLNEKFDMIANYHKFLLNTPVLGKLAKRIGGGITLPSVEYATNYLIENPNTILGTMPEGSNCVYKHETPVAEFKQFGLIKAAILSDSMILLTTQKGTENWDITFPFKIRYKNRIGLNVPMKFRPIELKLNVSVFDPEITSKGFKSLSKNQQRDFIKQVSHKMRLQMIRAHNAL